jgi:hypothetical protein
MSPEAFGTVLTGLLNAPPATARLRPLKPPAHPNLERRAHAAVRTSKHIQLERGHVKDVIGGWAPRPSKPFSEWADVQETTVVGEGEMGGAEKERELRRLAQRGVVKLFNAIRAAQGAVDEAKAPVKPKKVSDAPAKEATSAVEQKAFNILGSKGKEAAREWCSL